MTLSYDGTAYSGFQSQLNLHTIEDEIKHALKKITGEKISPICAGRTDAGVHAEGQVVNFIYKWNGMKEKNWLKAVNSLLPDDIRVLKCEFVDPGFHARRSAIYREYWYTIINAQTVSALEKRYVLLHPFFRLDTSLMNEYGKILIGENDFTSFCSTRDSNKSKVRYMHSINVERENDRITIKIIANAFLHNMVRAIVGTMLLLHKTNGGVEEMRKIMLAKDRKKAGPTAGPSGLVMKKVHYDESVLKREW